MADAAATASQQKAAHPVNPDRVGEELADDANIWQVYDRVAKEDDERRTKTWDNGLNNLALFAGLFSAVTTAFIIEAQQDMKPDYAQLTFLVLNATASGEKFVQEPFAVPPSARTINCLWIASLILSLSASLIAIMGKDWIGMYTSRPVCNLRQWAEMRTYRLLCDERWYMSGVIAFAPVLLHVSLLLFGAGLVIFISTDPMTHHLTLALSLAAGILYLITTLSGVVFSASPFKSPATQMLRSALATLNHYIRGIVYRPKRDLVHSLLGAINEIMIPDAITSATSPQHLWGHLPQHDSPYAGVSAIPMFLRSVRVQLHALRTHMRWSTVKLRLQAAISATRARITPSFTSSTWTELSSDRRPALVAESLSWLNGASQAPDVLRALIS